MLSEDKSVLRHSNGLLKRPRNVLSFARNLYDFHTMLLQFELSGFWLKNDESVMKLVPCKRTAQQMADSGQK